MAEAVMRLKKNAQGDVEITIDYVSDPGSTSYEHEIEHKKLVNGFVNGEGSDVGRVIPENNPPAKNQVPKKQEKREALKN